MKQPFLYRSNILANLSEKERRRLELVPRFVEAGHKLTLPGDRGDKVLFLETGLASTVVAFTDGKQVETNLLGPEAVIGLFQVLSTDDPRYFTHMEISGTLYVAPVEAVRREFAAQGTLHDLLIRFLRFRLYETMQVVACNGIHTQRQRFARWLLQCSDRLGRRTLEVSQSRLAELLASRLSGVSEASSELQELDIIAQHRGRIEILDPLRLETRSCECIHVIRQGLREQARALSMNRPGA